LDPQQQDAECRKKFYPMVAQLRTIEGQHRTAPSGTSPPSNLTCLLQCKNDTDDCFRLAQGSVLATDNCSQEARACIAKCEGR
jgi:hypothetical protein